MLSISVMLLAAFLLLNGAQGIIIKSYPNNARVHKSLIASQFNGVKVQEQEVSLKNGDHKTPEFLQVNPFGKVPTAWVSENDGIFESNSILRYVARVGDNKFTLYGDDDLEASKIDAFLDVVLSIDFELVPWLYPIYGYIPLDVEKEAKAKENIKKILVGFNRHLAGKKYLVGDSVSIADIGVTCSLLNPFKLVFTDEYLEDVPEVERWFKEMISLMQPTIGVSLRLDFMLQNTPAARHHARCRSHCHA
jgi:elongation factor 1-gamma